MESIPIPAEFARLLASPTTSKPKCPDCGGVLTVHVTLYTRGPVEVDEREEVRCDSCEWWCHPVDLELPAT